MSFKDYPIAYKMILVCLVTSVASLMLAATIIIAYNQYSFKKVLVQEISVLANVIANRSQAALVFDDAMLAQTNLNALHERLAVEYACIYRHNNQEQANELTLFTSYSRNEKDKCPEPQDFQQTFASEKVLYLNNAFDLVDDIKLDEKVIGQLLIRSSFIDAQKRLLNQSLVSLIALIIAALLALGLATRLAKIISQPLLKLGNTARKVAEDEDYTIRAQKQSDDEIGLVVESFNYMLNKIEQENANLKASEEKFRQLSSSSSAGIFQTDPSGRCIYANEKLSQIIGLPINEILNYGWFENIHNEDKARLLEQWQNCLRSGSPMQFESRYLHSNDTVVWVKGNVVQLPQTDTEAVGMLGTVTDISELKEAHSQLEHLAFYDILTGLANRRMFRDMLENLLEHTQNFGGGFALFFIDVDHFKHTNDTLGHDAGDKLLIELAKRLKSCVRNTDVVARLGGDEFTIIITDTEDEHAVSQIAQKIITELSEPITLGDQLIRVTASLGIAMAPENGQDAETLTKHADLALYKAKDEGRNNFQFFNQNLNEHLIEHLELMRDLREAIVNDEFSLNYQPQLDLKTGQVVGLEALIRWHSSKRGFVSPVQFIPAAEETGQIIALGSWVLRTACAQMRKLIDQGLVIGDCKMAVNLSAKQLVEPDLVHLVKQTLEQTQLAPQNLELEITESMLMENINLAVDHLNQLKELGVSISIDDFGTGYSSLGYLKSLPVHIVKVDRSFVQDIPEDTDDMAITAAVIAMAHKLNYKVVAEGLETQEQLDFLTNCACDVGQGYLFSRPLTEDALKDFCQQKLGRTA